MSYIETVATARIRESLVAARQRHPAEAADAQNTDAVAVDGRVQAEKVHGRAEVLGVDVRRCRVPRLTTAFPGIRRIEGQRDESPLGHRLCIQARHLFLHGTKRTADGQRWRSPASAVLRQVQVSGERDAVPVPERDLLMIDSVALRKGFVPFLRELYGA